MAGMVEEAALEPRTRGYRKREKTRSQLIEAGLRVLAEKGEALTVSDVVAAADVSNGTFYNYFSHLDELVDALAERLLLDLTRTAAAEPISDPALRFALASSRVLERAARDPSWGRVVLRLVDRPDVQDGVLRHLREDLAAGARTGRFDTGPDDATLDQVLGLMTMTIRRIIRGAGQPDTPKRAVERALRALGLPQGEAGDLSARAVPR